MARFKKGEPKSEAQKINKGHNRAILNSPEPNVSFSFKYFKEDDDFHINRETEYFQKVLYRLKDLSALTKTYLTNNGSKALRCHPIDWEDSKVSRSGFEIPNEEDLCVETYQISISKSSHGRVVGFFTENAVFNLVWFDKDHKLYPGI